MSAVIAQAPFVSATHLRHGHGDLRKSLIGTGLALYDFVSGMLGHEPVYWPLLGPENTLTALAGAEHERGYRKLVPPDVEADQRKPNSHSCANMSLLRNPRKLQIQGRRQQLRNVS